MVTVVISAFGETAGRTAYGDIGRSSAVFELAKRFIHDEVRDNEWTDGKYDEDLDCGRDEFGEVWNSLSGIEMQRWLRRRLKTILKECWRYWMRVYGCWCTK